jgi:predicted NAD/FAD-dependent oxidoreductase
VEVVVVGAGVAGLTAARGLIDAGHEVTVLDKGRRVGGRLSTRQFANGGRADAGAQFFTIRSDEFARAVAPWQAVGLVHEWCKGFSSSDGHPRYAVRRGMSQLGAAMAAGLEVRCSIHVERIRVEANRVEVDWPAAHGRESGRLVADAVVVTVPVPQAAALLGGDVFLPSISYLPTLSLMVALDRGVAISPSGGLQMADDPVWSFVGDNQAKGTSTVSVITFHSTSGFAASRLDDPVPSLTEQLIDAARPFLHGASVIETQLQRWLYATPADSFPERTFATEDGRIILAGDAFGGPKIEGAFLSGIAAADQINRTA